MIELAIRETEPLFVPCTANGCLYIIQRYLPSVIGKRVVVVGQSSYAGLPITNSLRNMRATVTLCNINTRNLSTITRQADILIVGIGNPQLIKADGIKPNSKITYTAQ